MTDFYNMSIRLKAEQVNVLHFKRFYRPIQLDVNVSVHFIVKPILANHLNRMLTKRE